MHEEVSIPFPLPPSADCLRKYPQPQSQANVELILWWAGVLGGGAEEEEGKPSPGALWALGPKGG